MRHLILTLSLVLGLAIAANAAFIDNRDAWVKVGDDYQEAFIMGLYEGIIGETNDDSRAAKKWKDKVANCMFGMNATSATLKDMIDNYYSDLANWSKPANQALIDALHKTCVKD